MNCNEFSLVSRLSTKPSEKSIVKRKVIPTREFYGLLKHVIENQLTSNKAKQGQSTSLSRGFIGKIRDCWGVGVAFNYFGKCFEAQLHADS